MPNSRICGGVESAVCSSLHQTHSQHTRTVRTSLRTVLLHSDMGIEVIQCTVRFRTIRPAVQQNACVSVDIRQTAQSGADGAKMRVAGRCRSVQAAENARTCDGSWRNNRVHDFPVRKQNQPKDEDAPALIRPLNLVVPPARQLLHCITRQRHERECLATVSCRTRRRARACLRVPGRRKEWFQRRRRKARRGGI